MIRAHHIYRRLSPKEVLRARYIISPRLKTPTIGGTDMINSSRNAEPARNCKSVRDVRIKYCSKRPTTFRCLLPFRFGTYVNVAIFRDRGLYPHEVKLKQRALVRFWNRVGFATRRPMVEMDVGPAHGRPGPYTIQFYFF